ncbi:Fanconi anemia group B protein [Anguilla anguilla]|uniref:Fanconi anemia group B protein n=1 Tax=Anguilla anguilla TaxID=7936 RepID=UPI0015AE97CD|nr:Fanconi anemia group B protein [Anguilla anguilla]XP_035250029.1 Fanconi anemia group B protein [Anguilla anguilla]
MDAPPSGAVFSQRGQPSKLLNHNGDILSFQFIHSLASGGESQRGSELRVTRMSFHRETKAFPIKIEGMTVINKSSSTSVDVVDCASVVDVKVGLTVPCLLLKQRKKKGAHFKYILLTVSHSNSLCPHLEFKLLYEIKDNLTFLQGPTVLWRNAGIIYYMSLQVGEVKPVPLRLSSVSFIGELPLDKRKIIIFGSQISSKERTVDAQADVWGQRNLGYFLEEGKEFDGAWVLPHAYSSVVKCMLLISAEEDEDGLKSTVVAATCRKQLVWFEGGAPRDICVLPFEEPQNILMVDTGRNGCFFAISFSHGNVCTVWKDSFQVASCWQGVFSLLVDDFVGCGTDQALILFDDHCHPGAAPTNFIITDLGDITYTSNPESSEGLHGADTVQENHLLTVQALESRLQSGMASIQDLQRDLEEKERVVRQSARALTDLVSGREHALPSAQQEGLVSLWDDDDEDEEGLAEELLAPPPALPTVVEKVWHRVMEDRLVVGVQLTADAAPLLESASLSFLIEAGQGPAPPVVQAKCRSFRLPRPAPLIPTGLSGLEPPAKRKKPDQAGAAGLGTEPRLTVTAVTELAPLLACASLPCRVLLHLAAAPWRPGGPLAMHCGFIGLDIQDTAQGKLTPRLLNDRTLTTAEASEDLLSLLAASDSWCFQIGCSDHTLFDMPQWLLGALRCERLLVQPDFILSDPQRLLSPMLFQWQERTPFTGELVVYCRGLHRLLQFLDSLCRCLPPSHWIHPLGQKRAEQDPVQALASSLEREALALREGVASLLHRATSREEAEGLGWVEGTADPVTTGSAPTDCVPNSPADELHRHRAEWGMERERSRRRLSPLVDTEHYRRLVAALSQVQLETDIAALDLCEAWPLPTAPCPD